MYSWLKSKPMIFFEISLLCNFLLGLFYQAPQTGFILTEGIKVLLGPTNVVFGIEIISIGLWMFFIYLIVEKWHVTPPDIANSREFIVQGILPVGAGCIIGAISIALNSDSQYSTVTIVGLNFTTYINSVGTFLTKFFSIGMVLLVVFNTAIILLMYITLYNHKINRDVETEQKLPLSNNTYIDH